VNSHLLRSKNQSYNPNRGKTRSQIGVPYHPQITHQIANQGPKWRSHITPQIRVPNRGPKLGSQIRVPDRVPYRGPISPPKSGSQIGGLKWGSKSGSKIGVQNQGPKWRSKMEVQNGGPKWGSTIGVQNRGPKFPNFSLCIEKIN
jgi:hypothetical protein